MSASQLELLRLVRTAASDAEPGRARALGELAAWLERRPPALPRLAPPGIDRAEVHALIAAYGHGGAGSPDSFEQALARILDKVAAANLLQRPWWAYIGPIPYLVAMIRGRRKLCPECAEQVKESARVCRYCGHRFGGLEHVRQ